METVSLILQITVVSLLALIYKKYLASYLSKKGENLATKEDIAIITDKIESVKSVYERRNLKFDYFHRKQAKVLGEIYSLLVDAVDAMYDMTVPIRFSNGKTNQQRMEEANKKVFLLQEFYKRNRIYFNKEIREKFESIIKEMYESYVDYDFSQLESLDRKEKSEHIKSAFGKLEKTALPIYDEIEELFRKILNEELI